MRRQHLADRVLQRVQELALLGLGGGLEACAREEAPGLGLERHLASLPGALPQLDRRLEQGELVDPGREAARAAEVVEPAEHAHQRVVGRLERRCRRARRLAGAAAWAAGARPRSAPPGRAARAAARSRRPGSRPRREGRAATRATPRRGRGGGAGARSPLSGDDVDTARDGKGNRVHAASPQSSGATMRAASSGGQPRSQSSISACTS